MCAIIINRFVVVDVSEGAHKKKHSPAYSYMNKNGHFYRTVLNLECNKTDMCGWWCAGRQSTPTDTSYNKYIQNVSTRALQIRAVHTRKRSPLPPPPPLLVHCYWGRAARAMIGVREKCKSLPLVCVCVCCAIKIYIPINNIHHTQHSTCNENIVEVRERGVASYRTIEIYFFALTLIALGSCVCVHDFNVYVCCGV